MVLPKEKMATDGFGIVTELYDMTTIDYGIATMPRIIAVEF
jgi:hypothetical protein